MFPPCLIQAAHAYAVPAAQLERIVETTAARRARGRAVGLGPAGIQPGWLPVLRQAGFPVAQLATHTCANLKAAAWILREAQLQRIADQSVARVPAYLVRYAEEASSATGVPKTVLLAVAWQESGFQPEAVSPKGAEGLMQFMPATWERFGQGSPFDPEQALFAGARYLRYLYARFHNWDLVFAGYNAGSQAVISYGYRIPPYQQTEAYVPDVLRHYWQLKGHLEPTVSAEPAPNIIESSPPG
jgi:soluble lytic murein transglycosylase-like protein